MKKASHERMLNDRGRKVIKENAGNGFNSYDHYKNMHQSDFPGFDQEWNDVAGQLGFKPNSNALEYGGGGNHRGSYNERKNQHYAQARGLGMPSNDHRAEARGLGMPSNDHFAEARGLGGGYMDDGRRGHYIPSNARGQNMPVQVNRGGNDLMATQPGGRVQPLPPARGMNNT